MATRLLTGRPNSWDSISGRGREHWGPLKLESVGTGTLSPEVKRTGREADHSYTYNTEIRNAWMYKYIYILPYIFVIVFN
jgi:hypothetical protein